MVRVCKGVGMRLSVEAVNAAFPKYPVTV